MSRSDNERNTDPVDGSAPNAAVWLFEYASPNVFAIPITSPVDLISGPKIESTPVPSFLRNLFQGRTASFTEIPFGTPSPDFGKRPWARSSAMFTPVEINAAHLANGLPVALLTNGTVREALGFASKT